LVRKLSVISVQPPTITASTPAAARASLQRSFVTRQLVHLGLAAIDLDRTARLPARAVQERERARELAIDDRRRHAALGRRSERGATRDRRGAFDREPAQHARCVALRVDAEHRLLTDVAALAVVEEPGERRLERKVILVDIRAVAQEAGADPQPFDLGIVSARGAVPSGGPRPRRSARSTRSPARPTPGARDR